MMKKDSLKNIYIKELVEKNFENSKKLNIEEARKLPDCEEYFFDELQNIEVNGFPFASDFVDKDGNSYSMVEYPNLSNKKKKEVRLKYYYLPKYHELYIGTTGSGKTTGCVEPQIRALVTQKNKPNLFISDPKGEIYNNNAEYMIKQGYQVKVLNFKNIRRSDRWNPIREIYCSYMRLEKLNDDFSRLLAEKLISYDGFEFKEKSSFINYVLQKRTTIENETDSLINQFVNLLLPVESKNDKTWEQGGQEAMTGILYIMLDLAIRHKTTGFTEEKFTIKTMFDIFNHFTKYFDSSDRVGSSSEELTEHPLLKNNSKAFIKIQTVFAAPTVTRKSYTTTISSRIRDWSQGHIFALTTGQSFNVEELEGPYAIFIVTRDYEKSDYTIAGLFIDYVYRTLIKKAEEEMSKDITPRTMHFILDEFANIPKIPNFEMKISTSRSRNIYMHLFLQTYEQLDNVYEPTQAKVIVGNCNNRVFLGSQSYDTIQKFSSECGLRSYVTSAFNDKDVPREIKVVTSSNLDLIEIGSMYMKRIYTPVIYTRFIRSYFLRNEGFYKYFSNNALNELPMINDIIYSSPEYSLNFKEFINNKNEDDD